MQILDAAATAAALPFPALIAALRDAHARGAQVPLRHTHPIADPPHAGGTVLLMPAWREGGLFGLKTVTIFPANGAAGLPGLHSVYTLFDARRGVPLALLDGNEITSRRTAAVAALAASFLARADARRLLVLGSGRVARLLPAALRCVRPIDEVMVWNHRPAGAQRLADELVQQGFAARAVDSLAQAVPDADIVSAATLSTTPLVRGEWLAPGTHLDLIGSFSSAMREADAACFSRSRVWVDGEEALAKSGDVLGALADGGFAAAQLAGTLAALCRGECAGRGDPAEISLFKSVGSALSDLAAAELIWAAQAHK